MVHIPVTISKERDDSPSQVHVGYVLATFIIGGLLGIFSSGSLPLPRPANIGNELGAVASVTSGETAHAIAGEVLGAENRLLTEDGTLTDVEILAPTIIEVPQIVTPTVAEQSTTLSASIDEKTLAVDRLALEMERIKNESVELVSGFKQNCGDNWKDECAIPYKEALDKNNTTYERLVQAHAAFNLEISNAQSALAELVQ